MKTLLVLLALTSPMASFASHNCALYEADSWYGKLFLRVESDGFTFDGEALYQYSSEIWGGAEASCAETFVGFRLCGYQIWNVKSLGACK